MRIMSATLTGIGRAFVGLALLGALGSSLVSLDALHAAPEETAARQAHPLYDDGGTLDWRTKWADAAQIAKERRSLIFVEWGRES
jgi:hypothetical protein